MISFEKRKNPENVTDTERRWLDLLAAWGENSVDGAPDGGNDDIIGGLDDYARGEGSIDDILGSCAEAHEAVEWAAAIREPINGQPPSDDDIDLAMGMAWLAGLLEGDRRHLVVPPAEHYMGGA